MPDFEGKIVVRFRHRPLLLEAIRCGDVFLRRRFWGTADPCASAIGKLPTVRP